MAVTNRLPCFCTNGCGRDLASIGKPWRRDRQYCSKRCNWTHQQRLAREARAVLMADPEYRRRMTRAANLARRRTAALNARRFRTKAKAYAAGYRSGYQSAARWYRHLIATGRIGARGHVRQETAA